jgi:hypothetical protein
MRHLHEIYSNPKDVPLWDALDKTSPNVNNRQKEMTDEHSNRNRSRRFRLGITGINLWGQSVWSSLRRFQWLRWLLSH